MYFLMATITWLHSTEHCHCFPDIETCFMIDNTLSLETYDCMREGLNHSRKIKSLLCRIKFKIIHYDQLSAVVVAMLMLPILSPLHQKTIIVWLINAASCNKLITGSHPSHSVHIKTPPVLQCCFLLGSFPGSGWWVCHHTLTPEQPVTQHHSATLVINM